MNKETIDWYKSHGICYHCGQRDVKPGCQMCHECLANKADTARIWYHSLPDSEKQRVSERNKGSARKTEENRRKAGLCHRCGQRSPVGNTKYSQCAVCRAKKKEYTRQWRIKHGNIPREERREGENCYRCAKPVTTGKYCPECHEIVVRQMLYARQFLPEGSGWHSFKFDFRHRKE